MIRMDAANALPISLTVIFDKYRETGSKLFVFRNVIGASIAFQYSRKFKIKADTIPGIPSGRPI